MSLQIAIHVNTFQKSEVGINSNWHIALTSKHVVRGNMMKKLEGEYQSNVRIPMQFVGFQTLLLLMMLSRWNLTMQEFKTEG